MKWLIRLYQRTLSPDHGPLKAFFPNGCCRFYPTCSDYAIQAISRFGYLKGGLLAVRRLFRCHPWGKFGPDPVDQKPPGYPQS